MTKSQENKEQEDDITEITRESLSKYFAKQMKLFKARDDIYTRLARRSSLIKTEQRMEKIRQNQPDVMADTMIKEAFLNLEQRVQSEMKEILTNKKELENPCKVNILVNYTPECIEIVKPDGKGILVDKFNEELSDYIGKKPHCDEALEGLSVVKTKHRRNYKQELQDIVIKINSSEDFKKAKLELVLAYQPVSLAPGKIPKQEKNSYTIKEAAEILNITETAVRYRIKSGKLSASECWGKLRIPADELRENQENKEISLENIQPEERYDVNQVANFVGVTGSAIRQQIKNGSLHATKEGKKNYVNGRVLMEFARNYTPKRYNKSEPCSENVVKLVKNHRVLNEEEKKSLVEDILLDKPLQHLKTQYNLTGPQIRAYKIGISRGWYNTLLDPKSKVDGKETGASSSSPSNP